jgi:hypothetical protein
MSRLLTQASCFAQSVWVGMLEYWNSGCRRPFASFHHSSIPLFHDSPTCPNPPMFGFVWPVRSDAVRRYLLVPRIWHLVSRTRHACEIRTTRYEIRPLCPYGHTTNGSPANWLCFARDSMSRRDLAASVEIHRCSGILVSRAGIVGTMVGYEPDFCKNGEYI